VTAPRRPGSLLASLYLYAGASAFWLAAAVATLFAIPEYRRHYSDLAQSAEAGAVATLLLLLAAGLAVCGVLVTVLLTLLDGYGWSGARAMTWVYTGLSVLVAGTVVLADPFAAIPWHRWLMTGTAVLTALLLAGGAVLLAGPASGRFFREYRAARQRIAAQRRAARHRQPFRPGPAYPYPPVVVSPTAVYPPPSANPAPSNPPPPNPPPPASHPGAEDERRLT